MKRGSNTDGRQGSMNVFAKSVFCQWARGREGGAVSFTSTERRGELAELEGQNYGGRIMRRVGSQRTLCWHAWGAGCDYGLMMAANGRE